MAIFAMTVSFIVFNALTWDQQNHELNVFADTAVQEKAIRYSEVPAAVSDNHLLCPAHDPHHRIHTLETMEIQ